MSNFDFLTVSIPEVHQNALKAESALRIDAPMAAIYSRITLEQLIDYLYRVRSIPLPYGKVDATLNERLRNPEFLRLITVPALTTKMHLIRRIGNDAAHGKRITSQAATQAVLDLHHLLIWAVRYHCPHEINIDPRTVFDLAKVPHIQGTAPKPKTSKELIQLAEELEETRKTHQAQLAQKDAENKALQERLAQLEERLKHTFTGTASTDIRDYDEAQTRAALIDYELEAAGWDIAAKNLREVPVPDIPIRKDGTLGTGSADYVLWGVDGKPLAVIEAKRTKRDPSEGQYQAELYARGLYAQYGVYPVIITTNGADHTLWDKWEHNPNGKPGYPPRAILAFPTRDDLERMHARRNAKSLKNAPISEALVDRPYQIRAVRAVGNAFDEENRRRALLVMATGTGKTRTSMAIVKMLSDAGWVKNTLFLADRIYLVTQAVNAFRGQFKTELSVVNLLTDKNASGRVYGCTYPTIMSLIDQRKFSPGFFDLIIVDEAHRSVYAKYRQIFEYFDSLVVGLTATPKDEVDRDTYALFELNKGEPTDHYPLETAVAEGYLVPPRGISLGTEFLTEGIRYDSLTDEEKEKWDLIDWDEETDEKPTHIEPQLLNTYLFNQQTVDHVINELMTRGHRVENGNKLGKTIIFAHNQNHAQYLKARFDALYPHYGGSFARVITHSTERAQALIDDFSDPQKMPQVAISVDMLDTGVDVPEVLNLVFFKAVRSYAKYWQMIGRGTRLCPDIFGPGAHKQDFLVFDCCRNIEFFNNELATTEGTIQKSQAARTLETTLALLTALDSPGNSQVAEADYQVLRSAVVQQLRGFVCSLNTESPFVRKHLTAVQTLSSENVWSTKLDAQSQAHVLSLAELGGNIGDGSPEARTFDLTVRTLQLDLVEGNSAAAAKRLERIRDIAVALTELIDRVPAIEKQKAHLDYVLSEAWNEQVSLARLEAIREDIRGIIHLLPKHERKVFYTDFADTTFESVEAQIQTDTTSTVDPTEFEAKIAHRMRTLMGMAVVQKARDGYALTEEDEQELDAAFVASGEFTVTDILTMHESHPNLGLFLRSIMGMSLEAVQEHLKVFIQEDATEEQIRLVTMLTDALIKHGTVDPASIFGEPYVDTRQPDYTWLGDVAATVQALNQGIPQNT